MPNMQLSNWVLLFNIMNWFYFLWFKLGSISTLLLCLPTNCIPIMLNNCAYYSVVLVSIRQILLVKVLFLERILESSLVLVLGGSTSCK